MRISVSEQAQLPEQVPRVEQLRAVPPLPGLLLPLVARPQGLALLQALRPPVL